MRHLYSFILYLLTPFVLLKLLYRSKKAPAYRQRWRERFALYSPPDEPGVIWFHAVSVGEAEAAFPLIQAIQNRYPEQPILVTTTTPTGSARVKAVFEESVRHVYFPYDLPDVVCRFLKHFKPRIAVMMETEIWPNLFHQCHQQKIPLLIINARLSDRSTQGYRKLAQFTQETLSHVSHIATRSENDASRFISLGASPDNVSIAGNIKFDLKLPASLLEQAEFTRQSLFLHRPVWIAASTHEGEDEQVLSAFIKLRRNLPQALLVLVPRHPERFDKVASLCKQQKLNIIKRTDGIPCDEKTNVFLLNTMGELKLFSAASDVAFVGGSLVPTGGHNVLEPAAAGVPVLFGPHMFNFQEIADLLLKAGAAIQVGDDESLSTEAEKLLQHAEIRSEMGEKGQLFVEENRGALKRLENLLGDYLEATEPSH